MAPGDEPTNPYRFNGKRWNAQSGTYDMGARDYEPSINQFISKDTYNDAAADSDLGADPTTSNRYAFTAGNPVNNIEIDGHASCDVGCQARSQYRMDGDPVIPDPETLEYNIQSHDGSTGLEDWLSLTGIAKEISGLADIQGCWNNPSAWQCTIAAASVIPPLGNELKDAKYLEEGVEAVSDAARAPKELAAPVTATELRNSPGDVTGGSQLPDVQGQWLRGSADPGNAGRIPGQVARALQGREFNNFNDFREEFWEEISNHPGLVSQFPKAGQTLMRGGKAPFAPLSQWVGKNGKYVLHHVTPIQHGGGVYDLDNLIVVSPRYHKEVLDPRYHQG